MPRNRHRAPPVNRARADLLPASAARGLSPEGGSRGDDALERALAHAGRLLARRARTEAELRTRLREGGHGPDAVEAAVARLKTLDLVDDRAFARRWIEERARTRPRSGAALRRELEGKGIDPSLAEIALRDAGVDDEAQARAVAERALPRWAGRPPELQARRVFQLLQRRGFDAALAESIARALLLPPEGWD
jgi:regulatory protein